MYTCYASVYGDALTERHYFEIMGTDSNGKFNEKGNAS
jgi:hypothetical protein